ncbi:MULTISPECIES: ABC transporter substrate-binding protein [Marinomonas]|uniref:Amino acid ABC transporter substrate-binding protein (PAAT family) n=1 Tax=Marinomonas alcarazii TaxID=491949 RepID=A0A318UTU9_9GAMM|nr:MULTISPECIES: transporter substrate-binding domain-containing protein [Marinomonas]PYF78598.1 amino acid ABC transporter substrate-binding protein (PAAT family) [Marinomonas alcarazii]
MRLHTHLVCCLLMATFFKSSAVLGEETLPSSCTQLTASGNSEYPPFLWQAQPNAKTLQGVNRLIIDELSQRIDIPIRLVHVGPWSRAQNEVKNGRIDLMAGAFYTTERADYMDYFTPVMLHTTSVVWQRKDKPFAFDKKEDLIGKWGVTVINNSFGQEFDQFAQSKLSILSVASLSQALRMLAADRVDYVLYEKSPAQAYSVVLGLSDTIVARQPFISSEGLYLTMSKKSPCNNDDLKYRIAIALQEMRQEGFTEKALVEGEKLWEESRHAGLSLE